MRKTAYFFLSIIQIASCTILSKSDTADKVLLSINGESILADEFLYVYEKNNFNNDSIYIESDVDDYFELFVNFKLKVSEAKANGIDTTDAFLSEFETYKDQLIKPYLSEAKEQERLVKEAYERMKYEIDASHILVTVDPQALPEDTLKSYQKISEVYEKAKSGEDFGALAVIYSEDPSAKTNKGGLGYFSAFQMVYPFEEAAYTTPIDSISDILRSRFGYHIIKVHDKRPYSGKIKVSHIMLRIDVNQPDTISVRNKIFEIHDQIIGGADWNELCQRYSDDQRTKNSGGTLPLIGLRQINDTSFENAAFNLETPGEISDPVRSKFGWHIIKLEERIGLEPFEEIREDLEQRVSKDDRSRMSRQVVISTLKVQNNFREVPSARDLLLNLADSSLVNGKWDVSVNKKLMKDTLFSIADKQYYMADAIREITQMQRQRAGITPEAYMNELLDKYIEQTLIDFEEKQLIETNRDFRMLLNEYYEGILLFEIMNEKVWGKAVEDTIGLQTYFDDNLDSYYWEERADAIIISSENRDIIKEVQKALEKEQLLLLEVDFVSDQPIEVLKNETLDSLIMLYNKFDSSTIIIYADSSSLESILFNEITSFFNDHSIPKESISVKIEDVLKNKIRLQLNSKSKKSLEYLYNQESALNLQVTEQLFERGDNQLIDSIQWERGIYELNLNDSYTIILINEILDQQPKKLKDVKGLVISDYQNYLEKNWIENLRKEYSIEINSVTLDKIKKAYRKKLNSTD